jgi:hypothetical protein
LNEKLKKKTSKQTVLSKVFPLIIALKNEIDYPRYIQQNITEILAPNVEYRSRRAKNRLSQANDVDRF